MAVSRLSQTSLQNAFQKFNNTWDGSSAVGSMEAISAVTLTSTQKSVDFNSIPQTYTHLHLRVTGKSNRAANSDSVKVHINNDLNANYTEHGFYTDGASPLYFGTTSTTGLLGYRIGAANALSGLSEGSFIMDILDYTNTNKNKTSKSIGGVDYNGGGDLFVNSSVWLSTAAITSLTLIPVGSFLTGSSISLFGIK